MGLAPFAKAKVNTKVIEQDQLTSNKMVIESWIQLIHVCKDDALIHGFHQQWGRHGPLNFVLNFAAPLLERVGKGWETGELSISHEHFASECIVSSVSYTHLTLQTNREV